MGLQQTKKLLRSEGNHQNIKRKHKEWEKIFANGMSDKGLISKKKKKTSYNSTSKNKQTTQLKNGQRI